MHGLAAQSSPQFLFEKFDVGVIHLDAKRRVLAMNDLARKTLPIAERQPFNQIVPSFHPERSRAKVNMLLDQAAGCPMAHSIPMTMIINIPEQVLLIKLTRLDDVAGAITGFVLVFYDVTAIVQADQTTNTEPSHRHLQKIPALARNKISFVDTQDIFFIESQAHTTRLCTPQGFELCNLGIGDLALRLDAGQFMRVHRCFVVNLNHVSGLVRRDAKTFIHFKSQPNLEVPVSRDALADLRSAMGLSARKVTQDISS